MDFFRLIESRFLPSIIKPGRFAGVEWTSWKLKLDAFPHQTVAVVAGDEYQWAVNNPGRVAILGALSGCESLAIGSVYALDQDSRDRLRELGGEPFLSPGFTPLSRADAVICHIARPSDLFRVCQILSDSGIPLSQGPKRHQFIVAVCASPWLPSVFDTIFDAVWDIADFLWLDFPRKGIEGLRRCDQPSGERPSVFVIPPGQVIPSVETPANRARFTCIRPPRHTGGTPQSAEEIAAMIFRAVKASGETDIELGEIAGLRDGVSVGEVLSQLSADCDTEKTTLTLRGVTPGQVDSLAIRAALRFSRLRLEMTIPSLSPTLYSRLDPLHNPEHEYASLREALGGLSHTRVGGITLDISLGGPIDPEREIGESVRTIRTLADVIHPQRGLRLRVSSWTPTLDTPAQWGALPTQTEFDARFAELKRRGRTRGVSYAALDQRLLRQDLRALYGEWDSIESALAVANGEDVIAPMMDTPGGRDARIVTLMSSVFGDRAQARCDELASQRDHPRAQSQETAGEAIPEMNMSVPVAAPSSGDSPGFGAFGRGRRKAPTRATAAPTQSRLRFVWAKHGSARFLSHLDNCRAVEAAIIRANLPVSYSQGPKPRMKVSFGPPLPLGYTASAELFDANFETLMSRLEIDSLAAAFAPGFTLVGAEAVYTSSDSIMQEVYAAEYLIAFDAEVSAGADGALTPRLSETELWITRETKSGERRINIRPGILAVEAAEGGPLGGFTSGERLLRLTLSLTDEFFVRPEEALVALGLLSASPSPDTWPRRVHRQALLTGRPRTRMTSAKIAAETA